MVKKQRDDRKAVRVTCEKDKHFTQAQSVFLQCICVLCSRNIDNEQQRKKHQASNKKTHRGPCTRCSNYFDNGDENSHTFTIHGMYFAEAVAARFPEALELNGIDVAPADDDEQAAADEETAEFEGIDADEEGG
ncbi:uncharacterized protein LOC120283299 [Dioscorea cayenensis subsp. rotundata]|uniref:Uncharacterized protein LOC120283299 n=1 Tax=Dioscorea cayennensis subsp. rotundata TaxID=55577 RepID=A0AB40D439_DIOCR|nr:uncharacterized protein LOC120283299 [Dioscorea cayenensis subsp. rotundata]